MKQKAFKFRIYPNKNQQEYFDKCFRTSNFIYNYFLNEQRILDNMLKMYGLEIKEDRNKYKKENKLYFNSYSASKELTKLSKNDKYKFLSEIDSTARGTSCEILENAFANIWKTHAGYPKFKNNRTSNKSFKGQILYNSKDSPQNFKIKIKDNSKNYYNIDIPKLKGLVTVIHQKEFLLNWNNKNQCKINSYTVSKNNDNSYYISLQVEDKLFIQPDKLETTYETSIGIDFGIERPITTSDINDYNNKIFSDRFDLLKKEEQNLLRLNRIISKKMIRNKDFKNSNKYHRLRNKINKIHQSIKNKRDNIQHNITRQLVDKSNITSYILEDLSIVNMTKRSSKNIKQKSGLNKAILDVGFYSLYQKLNYKAESVGKYVYKVDPKYTSQKCSNCNHISKNNRLTQANFKCINCGHEMNADLNASINIKNKFFNKLG